MATTAMTFQMSKNVLQWLANLLRSILPTTSTLETQDRWESVIESLTKASTLTTEMAHKESLEKVAIIIYTAWETGATGEVPECLQVQDGQVLLTCHVSETMHTDLARLQDSPEPNLDELYAAELDLAHLVSHCSEADFGQTFDDMQRSQIALANAIDALNAQPEEHIVQA